MSGGGRGYCMLKLPEKENEPLRGYAGMSGRAVIVPSVPPSGEVANLRAKLHELAKTLKDLQNRLRVLDIGHVRNGAAADE